MVAIFGCFSRAAASASRPKEAEPFGVVSQSRREHFDGHLTLQLGVVSEIHLAHPALTEGANDAVVPERGPFFHQP